ncbi:MAG: hypothetical protein K2N80_17100 [Lachnospiraceae bacterium]|nr:hypothetical protein [Lachnospiraceae bacterium]
MNDTSTSTKITAESWMESLARLLAHQLGGTVQDLKIYKVEKAKDKTA